MANDFHIGKAALIVYLHGEIDQYAAADLKGRIDIEIESSPKKNLILELSEVELMDSSGIGLIVGRYKLVTAIGGKLALCCASDNVQRMIQFYIHIHIIHTFICIFFPIMIYHRIFYIGPCATQ